MCHNGSREEVPADRESEGGGIACQVEAWEKAPASGNRVCKALGAESWVVGAQRHRRGDLIPMLTVRGRKGSAQSSPACQQQSLDQDPGLPASQLRFFSRWANVRRHTNHHLHHWNHQQAYIQVTRGADVSRGPGNASPSTSYVVFNKGLCLFWRTQLTPDDFEDGACESSVPMEGKNSIGKVRVPVCPPPHTPPLFERGWVILEMSKCRFSSHPPDL